MTTTIPQELVDIILDYLHADLHVLATCGMVCRAWLPSSRYHLFRYVVLNPQNTYGFGELMSSPCSTIATSVQLLELSNEVAGRPSMYQWLEHAMIYLVDLSAVKWLRIRNMVWSELKPETKSILLRSFRTLRELELWAVDFKALTQLLDITCAFPALERISVDDLGWVDPSFEPPESPEKRLPSTVHTLHLGYCYKRDILHWILAHQPIPIIHHIHLGTVYQKDTLAIGRYLGFLGSALHDLRLGFSDLDAGGDAESFHACVDLRLNTGLRSIRIDKFVHYSEYQLTSAVTWIPEILTQVISPHLKEVAFSVSLFGTDDLDPLDHPIDWQVLDQLFSESRFPQLQMLHFWIYGEVEVVDAVASITHKFPLCNERGILFFN